METILVLANEATAAKRRVGFDVRSNVDGFTIVTTATGGQPQISTDGGAWTNTGIGTLNSIGNGRYYADLTQAAVATVGSIIRTRYAQSDSLETVGSMVQVITAGIVGRTVVTIGASGSNTASTFLTDLTSAVTDFWKDSYFTFLTGALAGQTKKITGYNGSTKFLTTAAFTSAPATSDTGLIINF